VVVVRSRVRGFFCWGKGLRVSDRSSLNALTLAASAYGSRNSLTDCCQLKAVERQGILGIVRGVAVEWLIWLGCGGCGGRVSCLWWIGCWWAGVEISSLGIDRGKLSCLVSGLRLQPAPESCIDITFYFSYYRSCCYSYWSKISEVEVIKSTIFYISRIIPRFGIYSNTTQSWRRLLF